MKLKYMHAGLLLATLLTGVACTRDAEPAAVVDTAPATTDQAPVAGAGTPASTPELPVAIGEATPAPVTATRPGAEPLNAATVYDAVANGMGASAANIDVSVEGGIVVLKGTVKNQADFQAAHYISRALEGVDEVDASGLKVQ